MVQPPAYRARIRACGDGTLGEKAVFACAKNMPLSGLTTCAKSIQYGPLKAAGARCSALGTLGGFLSMNYEPTSLFDLPAIWSGAGGASAGLAPAPSRPTSAPFDHSAVLPVMWDEDEDEEDDDEDDEDDEFFDDESEFEEEADDDEGGDDDEDLDDDEDEDEDEEEEPV